MTPDDATYGGYLAKHDRPPAFEGSDGRAYSVDALIDDEPDAGGRFGAGCVFVQWTASGDRPAGHVETPPLVFGGSPDEALRALRELPLLALKQALDRAIEARAALGDW